MLERFLTNLKLNRCPSDGKEPEVFSTNLPKVVEALDRKKEWDQRTKPLMIPRIPGVNDNFSNFVSLSSTFPLHFLFHFLQKLLR